MNANSTAWEGFALLLIDVQQDFWTDRRAHHFPDFQDNVSRLLEFCRAQGLRVIHVRSSFQPDQSDWMVRYRLTGTTPCVQGAPGIEILPCAREAPGEKVFLKQTFDAFQNPDLVAYLRRQGVRFLLTAGLITSTCVFLTSASAAQNGFLVAMLEDCCADAPEAHQQTLERYPFIFARASSDRLVEQAPEWRRQIQFLSSTTA